MGKSWQNIGSMVGTFLSLHFPANECDEGLGSTNGQRRLAGVANDRDKLVGGDMPHAYH
jgi:hypothetical protein